MSGVRGILLASLAPLAWSMATLLGTALPGWSCRAGWSPEPWALALLLPLALLGAILCRRAVAGAADDAHRFAALIAAALAALLLLPLLLQFLAALILDPCAA